MKNTTTRLVLAASLAFALNACGDEAADKSGGALASANSGAKVEQVATAAATAKPSSKGGMSPVETTLEAGRLAKANDLKGLVGLILPAAQLKEAEENWEKTRTEPATEQERKEFADNIAKLIAPGAVDKLVTEATPQLEQLKLQMPMYVGMGMGMAQQAINSNAELSESEKKQAIDSLTAIQTWAGKTDVTDPARLRKALTELANGVRATQITTLDQVRALNFDQALGKGGVLFAAVKKSLAAYDFDLDQTFSSVRAEQVNLEGDNAVVKTTVRFLGQEISSEAPMVRVDGRWYGKSMIEKLKQVSAENSTESGAESKTGG